MNSNNNQSLSRIQQLSRKLRSIDEPNSSNPSRKEDIYRIRLQKQTKRWKQGIKRNESSMNESVTHMNSLIQTIEEQSGTGDHFGKIRDKIINSLEDIERTKSKTSLKIMSIKNSIPPMQSKPYSKREIDFDQPEALTDKLKVISNQTIKINKILLQTMNSEFDKLQSKLQQQAYQQSHRNEQLMECINALQKQISLAVEFQEKQLVQSFEEHHHCLQKIIQNLMESVE